MIWFIVICWRVWWLGFDMCLFDVVNVAFGLSLELGIVLIDLI